MTRRLVCPFSLFLFLAVASLLLVAPDRASAGTELTLHSFNPFAQGEYPSGGLIADSDGNLYGVAGGGAYGYGIVFELVPNKQGGWTEQILYNFRDGADGADPYGGVIFDAAGNLYGITFFGGPAKGTVFELRPNGDGSWTEKTLYNIGQGVITGLFQSGLVFDQKGNLYAATGGGSDPGSVFELSPSSSGEWTETALQIFSSSGSGGNTPIGPFVIDRSGNVFGVANEGGSACSYPGCGLVFELSPSAGGGWTETVIYNFAGGTDGEYPAGGLIADAAGNLYGTTFSGGTAQGSNGCACGTVFELSLGSNGQWTKTILYNFQSGSDGGSPAFALTFDPAGNLYGATYGGGGLGFCDYGGCGTIFELTRNGGQWSESVLWRFNNSVDGYDLSGPVSLNADGQLFGGLYYGHDSGQNGLLFALTNTGGQWSLTTVSGFVDSDGFGPETALVADGKGNLYGTTAFGGTSDLGAVFELTPASGGRWNEQMIYSFLIGSRVTGYDAFENAPSPLIVDSAGNLYGETEAGGLKNAGTVYELSPGPGGTWTEKILCSFPGVAGDAPSGGLVMDQAGHLYGTTQFGGADAIRGVFRGYGTVFELIPRENGTWSEKTLYKFAGPPTDGAQPAAGLVFDAAGHLYGTTARGGSGSCAREGSNVVGCGTAFELTLANGVWSETLLHTFLGGTQDGDSPGGLVLDKSGNLYGTTSSGGSGYNKYTPSGTAFELSPATGAEWNETLLFEFPDRDGQAAPFGNLILDASGNLYGTTTGSYGVGYPAGSVFELSPNSSGERNYQEVYSFSNLGIGSPWAGVIFGPHGYLYGTTTDGGGNFAGSVFAVKP